MASLAPSIRRPLGWAIGGGRPRAETHEFLRLLTVRATHGVVVGLLQTTELWSYVAPSLVDRPRLLAEVFVEIFWRNVSFWIIGLASIAVAQVKMQPGLGRTVVLVLWALIWSAFYNKFWLDPSSYVIVHLGLATPDSLLFQGLWAFATYLLLAVWYYESADRTRRSLAALRQSELARRGAERWLLELRLGSLQARLDPQVLFDTLDEACRLYRSRPAAAEELLDALIQYLRRALPHLRQAQSTLEQEAALALAFLRVLRMPNGEPLEIEAVVEPMAGDARFPPMVVQPICDALARLALASGEPARMSISVTRKQDCAHLSVAAQPMHAAPSRERLEEVRRTLLAMFGPLARIDTSGPTAGIVHVIVEVPYDSAPRTDS